MNKKMTIDDWATSRGIVPRGLSRDEAEDYRVQSLMEEAAHYAQYPEAHNQEMAVAVRGHALAISPERKAN